MKATLFALAIAGALAGCAQSASPQPGAASAQDLAVARRALAFHPAAGDEAQAFLKIPNITGGATAAGYKDWVPVSSYTLDPSTGAIDITIPLDRALPQILTRLFASDAQIGLQLTVIAPFKGVMERVATIDFGKGVAPAYFRSYDTHYYGNETGSQSTDSAFTMYSPEYRICGRNGAGTMKCEDTGPKAGTLIH
jgi:hypothetical protein